MSGMGNTGYESTVFTATTTGTQVFFTGVGAATSAVPGAQGLFHSITIGADTTANTIIIYDGSSTSADVAWRILTPTATPVIQLTPDIQLENGLFIAISGSTTVNITVMWL